MCNLNDVDINDFTLTSSSHNAPTRSGHVLYYDQMFNDLTAMPGQPVV
jgi:hypothetical protein